MYKSLVILIAIVGLVGCTMRHSPDPDPVDFEIDLAIAAATLADECGDLASRAEPGFAGDCAPSEDGTGDCGGWCDQSNVSVAITADADRALPFTVLRATLLSSDGAELMELSTANPRIYAESAYETWDETIPTPTTGMNVLYDLHGVDWSAVGGDDPWSTTYKVRLVVDVEGTSYTLTSDELTRQAPLVT
jgi:hypothetical protein